MVNNLILPLCLMLTFIIKANTRDTLLAVKQNGKWGFINQSGKLIIPFKYDAALDWGTRPLGKVKTGNQWMIINRNGEEIVLTNEGNIELFNDSILILHSHKGEFICDEMGRKLINQPFSQIEKIGKFHFTFVEGDLMGLGHIHLGIIVPAKFDNIQILEEDSLFLSKLCGYQGLINYQGNELLQPYYNSIKKLKDQYYTVSDGMENLKGLYDISTSKMIVEPLWEKIYSVNQYFVLLQNQMDLRVHFQLENKTNPEIYKMVSFQNELLFAVKDSLEGVVDKQGKILLPFENTELLIDHGQLIAKNDKGYSVYKTNGTPLLKGPFQELQTLETPNWLFKQSNNTWTLYDSTGLIILSNLIDPTIQKQVIKCKSENQMTRINLSKTGKINEKKTFKNVITIKVNSYSENRIRTAASNSTINETKSASNRWFLDEPSQKFGLKNSDGKILISPQYDDILQTDASKYTIVYKRKNGQIASYGVNQFYINALAGLVDNTNGKLILPLEYADILVTGDMTDPLIFGINKSFRFVQYVKDRQTMGATYLWVERTSEIPVRVLKKAQMVEAQYNSKYPQQYFNFKMLELKNKYVLIKDKKYFDPQIYYKALNPQWTYISQVGEYDKFFYYAERFNDSKVTRVFNDINNKWGLINKKMEYTSTPEYTSIEREMLNNNSAYKLTKDHTSIGIVYDNEIQLIIKNAAKILYYQNGKTYFNGAGGAGFWSKENGEVLIPETQDIKRATNNMIPVKKGGKWGFSNEAGAIIIDCQYSKVNPYYEGYATVKLKGKWALIDEKGLEVKKLPWKDIKQMGNLLITSNGKHWSISLCGDETNMEYPPLIGFRKMYGSKNLWCKGVGENFILNADGKIIAKTKSENVSCIGDSSFVCSFKNRKFLLIGSKIKKKIPKQVDIIWVKDNLMAIQRDSKIYLCDTSFQLITSKPYQKILCPIKGKVIARNRKNHYLLDEKGNEIQNSHFRLKENISTGYTIALDNRSNFFFIDSTGKIAPTGYFKRIISDGTTNYWVYKADSTWGLLDNRLQWLIKPKFKSIQAIAPGITKTICEKIYGYCNLDGKVIVPAQYPDIKVTTYDYIRAEIGDEVHWYDTRGNCIYENESLNLAEIKSKEK